MIATGGIDARAYAFIVDMRRATPPHYAARHQRKSCAIMARVAGYGHRVAQAAYAGATSAGASPLIRRHDTLRRHAAPLRSRAEAVTTTQPPPGLVTGLPDLFMPSSRHDGRYLTH